jgi:hypothetical protein
VQQHGNAETPVASLIIFKETVRPFCAINRERLKERSFMRSVVSIAVTLVVLTSAWLTAQEPKPVPKDSVRVTIPGCSKGYVFTASRRTPDEPGSSEITEGMHIRMNGPKKLMSEIKAHEGSMIAITGLMRKGQVRPDGVGIGGGIRVGPAPAGPGSSVIGNPIANQIQIDVEGWRPAVGECYR